MEKEADPTVEPQRWRDLTCARCGYGLRGLQGKRCPECGIPLEESERIAAARRRRDASNLGVALGTACYLLLNFITIVILVFQLDDWIYHPITWFLFSMMAPAVAVTLVATVGRRSHWLIKIISFITFAGIAYLSHVVISGVRMIVW